MYKHEVGHFIQSLEFGEWQQQLSDCLRAPQPQNRLIRRLAQAPNAPPGR